MRPEMMNILLDAYRHPDRRACFYSANLDRTGHPQLDALPAWDWTPQPARPVEGNTTCLFPLTFGCEEMQLEGGKIWVKPLFDENEREFNLRVPDVSEGYSGKILDAVRQMRQTLPAGERIREPDIQSPLGIAEMLCGQSLYFALGESPEAIHRLLGKITDFVVAFVHALHEAAGDRLNGAGFPFVWNDETGTLCSDDTLSLLSPEMHREFSLPYMKRVANEAGPLFYHSCSWYERYFDNIRQVPNVRAYNWNPGNSADPHRIIREFSGRAVLAPHISLGMHQARDVQSWGSFADEVELLAYILDGTQDNTTLYFWLGEFEKQPELLWRMYREFDKRGFSPAEFAKGKKPHDLH